jgi:hypothetical protein
MNTNIANPSMVIKDLVVSKWFTVSPSADDDRTKKCKLELTITDITVLEAAYHILKPEVIKVQNSNRPRWSKLANGQVFKKTINKPLVVDPTEAYHGEFDSMTPEQQQEQIKLLMSKAKKLEQPTE